MVMLGRLQDEELRTKLAPWRTNVDLKDRWRSLVKAAQSGDPKRAGGHLNPEQARPATWRASSERLEGAKPARSLTTLIRCTMAFRPIVCFAIARSAEFLVSQVWTPLSSCVSCELPKPALMFNATVVEGVPCRWRFLWHSRWQRWSPRHRQRKLYMHVILSTLVADVQVALILTLAQPPPTESVPPPAALGPEALAQGMAQGMQGMHGLPGMPPGMQLPLGMYLGQPDGAGMPLGAGANAIAHAAMEGHVLEGVPQMGGHPMHGLHMHAGMPAPMEGDVGAQHMGAPQQHGMAHEGVPLGDPAAMAEAAPASAPAQTA